MYEEDEAARIKHLFELLLTAPPVHFPKTGEPDCPTAKGVYIIQDPDGEVFHVGRTPSGANGLRNRLNNHLQGQSSFARTALPNQAARLRDGFFFRYLVVDDDRDRAILEHLAIGMLCPKHLGLGAASVVQSDG